MITENSRPTAASLHVAHCDAEDKYGPDHVCQGEITINAKFCTFDCKRCGQDRINITEQVRVLQEKQARDSAALAAFSEAMRKKLGSPMQFNEQT